jgi:hypothetical protein
MCKVPQTCFAIGESQSAMHANYEINFAHDNAQATGGHPSKSAPKEEHATGLSSASPSRRSSACTKWQAAKTTETLIGSTTKHCWGNVWQHAHQQIQKHARCNNILPHTHMRRECYHGVLLSNIATSFQTMLTAANNNLAQKESQCKPTTLKQKGNPLTELR